MTHDESLNDALYDCFKIVYDCLIDPPNMKGGLSIDDDLVEKRIGHLINKRFGSDMFIRYGIEKGWLPEDFEL